MHLDFQWWCKSPLCSIKEPPLLCPSGTLKISNLQIDNNTDADVALSDQDSPSTVRQFLNDLRQKSLLAYHFKQIIFDKANCSFKCKDNLRFKTYNLFFFLNQQGMEYNLLLEDSGQFSINQHWGDDFNSLYLTVWLAILLKDKAIKKQTSFAKDHSAFPDRFENYHTKVDSSNEISELYPPLITIGTRSSTVPF